MGALVTKAMRPIKSFNIENRAHRVISKEKPTPAPMYPGNVADLKRTIEAIPDIEDKLDKKDPSLDDRLKNVYVTSFGKPEDDVTREKQAQRTNRPLPQNRTSLEDFEYGLKEPDNVPYGRTTLRHAINFIAAHQASPDEVTATNIALEYKLKEEDVNNILKYFKTYEVYIPETKKSPAIFAGPVTSRKKLAEMQLKSLESKKSDDTNVDSKESTKIKGAP